MRWRLPSLEGRSVSSAFEDTSATRLGRAIAPLAAAHPGKSGVYPLLDAHDAFAARILLARAADRSLDIQYYIWNADLTGNLLFEAIHAAADRGVRVRLLLDDNNTWGLDATLAALDSHPNIEVRLFNPVLQRRHRLLGYLSDPRRLNRRMHNKSFTADNQATIIGGRNIGDEYFGAHDGALFADLDVFAVGPVVREVSDDFDRYWASASAYPADRILDPAHRDDLDSIAARASLIERDPRARIYVDAVRQSDFVTRLLENDLALSWASVRMVSDDPAKALGRASRRSLLAAKLQQILEQPMRELSLVSGYFVPTKAGVRLFTDMARRGVRITILTNALEATDVGIVHAGYVRRRRALLRAGITLYETRRQARGPVSDKRAAAHRGSKAMLRKSASTLHAKTFSVDRERVFIGSFNFDPRSVNINTEIGFVIHDPALADQVQRAFEDEIPHSAYQVCLSAEGRLYWLERDGDHVVRHDTEPRTSLLRRSLIWCASWLPIEGLL
ncbi:MAG: phospholipase D family protein [Gammaproteobacteria bacterium]|jgi:putative cardiolipin synthase|nr:phospholipase D family protein [Gammaproteobacteria bacterium]